MTCIVCGAEGTRARGSSCDAHVGIARWNKDRAFGYAAALADIKGTPEALEELAARAKEIERLNEKVRGLESSTRVASKVIEDQGVRMSDVSNDRDRWFSSLLMLCTTVLGSDSAEVSDFRILRDEGRSNIETLTTLYQAATEALRTEDIDGSSIPLNEILAAGRDHRALAREAGWTPDKGDPIRFVQSYVFNLIDAIQAAKGGLEAIRRALRVGKS